MSIQGYSAVRAKKPLERFKYNPADLGPFDVEIAITHCGNEARCRIVPAN